MWQISNVIRNSSHKIVFLLSGNVYIYEWTDGWDGGTEASEAIGKHNIIINTALYIYTALRRERNPLGAKERYHSHIPFHSNDVICLFMNYVLCIFANNPHSIVIIIHYSVSHYIPDIIVDFFITFTIQFINLNLLVASATSFPMASWQVNGESEYWEIRLPQFPPKNSIV